MSQYRKIDKRGDLRDAVFHYEQVAESDAGVIEITYAKPAKEDKPQAQSDFRRLLLGRAREGNRLRGENVNFCRI